MKAAILDTGIDRFHRRIEARDMNLKGGHNLCEGSQENILDQNGHGTFAASLILDYAPDVELYIIKIADKNALPDAKVIVKVSRHGRAEFSLERLAFTSIGDRPRSQRMERRHNINVIWVAFR